MKEIIPTVNKIAAMIVDPSFGLNPSSFDIDIRNKKIAIISKNNENVKRHIMFDANLQPFIGSKLVVVLFCSFDDDEVGRE
jgi:hypothetical protein